MKKIAIFAILLLLFVMLFVDQHGLEERRLGNAYLSLWIRDKEVVSPVVLDYRESGKYIVGIRLPAELTKCGYYESYIVENIQQFFLLDTETLETMYFYGYQEAYEAFKVVGVNDYISKLDSSRFDVMWGYFQAKYEKFSYYKDCEKKIDVMAH